MPIARHGYLRDGIHCIQRVNLLDGAYHPALTPNVYVRASGYA